MTLRTDLFDTLYYLNDCKVMCILCGRLVDKKDATIEHIIPKSKSGTNYLTNLSISHLECNQKRKNNDFLPAYSAADIKFTVTYEEYSNAKQKSE